MSQYGAGKAPPPWQQRPQAGMPLQASLLGQHPGAVSALSNQQLILGGVAQQQQYASIQQSMIQSPGAMGLQCLSQSGMAQMGHVPVSSQQQTVNMMNPGSGLQTQMPSISYPPPRSMNAPLNSGGGAFGMPPSQISLTPSALASLAPAGAPVGGTPAHKQRVFTGHVTKLCNDFGFVDDDVFFQTGFIKGPNPKIGDRVLVEASYNPNMPFRWNASRVQVIPGTASAGPATAQPSTGPPAPPHSRVSTLGMLREPNVQRSVYSAVPPPVFGEVIPIGNNKMRDRRRVSRSPRRSRSPNKRSRSPRRDSRSPKRARRRSRDRDRDVDRERERDRGEKTKDRERPPAKGKEERPAATLPAKRSRSHNRSNSKGTSPSPPRQQKTRPVAARYNVRVPKINVHIREASMLELKKRYPNLYLPSDMFAARPQWADVFPAYQPFLLPRPVAFHVLSKEVNRFLEPEPVGEPTDINFSFSAKVMLISVPPCEDIYRRSCSLSETSDGEWSNSQGDFAHPTRLINFLVGLTGKNETMAIGGPWSPSLDGADPKGDPQVLIRTAIRTCKALTGIDLSGCTTWYRFAEINYRRGESIYRPGRKPGSAARVETTVLFLPDVWNICPNKLEWDGLHLNYQRQLEAKLAALDGPPLSEDEPEDVEGDKEDEIVAKKDPTHWAALDIKTMKVAELRSELEARNLISKGLKSQLTARLVKTLKSEQEKEESDKVKEEEEEKKKKDEEESSQQETIKEQQKKEEEENKKMIEKQKAELKTVYALPESAMVLVHPSRSAKGGKFECTTMSLSVLLDYRPEDNKEHSFEVSLFAELFNEMLMRDFAFRIYRCIVDIPEEEKKESKKVNEDKDTKDIKKETKLELGKDNKDTKEVNTEQKQVSISQDTKESNDASTEERKTENTEEKKEKESVVASEEPMEGLNENSELSNNGLVAPAKEETSTEANVEEEVNDDDDVVLIHDIHDDEIFVDEVEVTENISEKKESISGKDGKGKFNKDKEAERDKGRSADKTRDRSSRDRSRHSSKDRDVDRREKNKKEKVVEKMVTVDPYLLLSFVYFDTSHCGYLLERDLEDIINLMGLKLSRAQMKKLMSRAVPRSSGLLYRKYTDVPLSQKDAVREASSLDLKELAAGNNCLMSYHGMSHGGDDNSASATKIEGEQLYDVSGVVSYKGSVVDIEKLLKQLERSEKARLYSEDQFKELENEFGNVKESKNKLSEKYSKISHELKSVQSALKGKERDLTKLQEKQNECQKVITAVHALVSPLIVLTGNCNEKEIETKVKKETALNGDDHGSLKEIGENLM